MQNFHYLFIMISLEYINPSRHKSCIMIIFKFMIYRDWVIFWKKFILHSKILSEHLYVYLNQMYIKPYFSVH